MANYTQQMASNFFFDFDNYFLWRSDEHPEILQAYGQAFGVDGIDGFYNQFQRKRKNGIYPQGLTDYFLTRKDAIDFIAYKQLQFLDTYFQNDSENEQQAFIDFGQGILFDARRATDDYLEGTEYYVVHTMDAKYDPGGYVPPNGYHRWYGFVRTYTLLNNINGGRFLDFARNITLAWQIQSELKPRGTSSDGTNPNNSLMNVDDLQNLKAQTLQMVFADMDNVFDHKPYPESAIV